METKFADNCDEKDSKQVKKRWFLEPATTADFANIRRTK